MFFGGGNGKLVVKLYQGIIFYFFSALSASQKIPMALESHNSDKSLNKTGKRERERERERERRDKIKVVSSGAVYGHFHFV